MAKLNMSTIINQSKRSIRCTEQNDTRGLYMRRNSFFAHHKANELMTLMFSHVTTTTLDYPCVVIIINYANNSTNDRIIHSRVPWEPSTTILASNPLPSSAIIPRHACTLWSAPPNHAQPMTHAGNFMAHSPISSKR